MLSQNTNLPMPSGSGRFYCLFSPDLTGSVHMLKKWYHEDVFSGSTSSRDVEPVPTWDNVVALFERLCRAVAHLSHNKVYNMVARTDSPNKIFASINGTMVPEVMLRLALDTMRPYHYKNLLLVPFLPLSGDTGRGPVAGLDWQPEWFWKFNTMLQKARPAIKWSHVMGATLSSWPLRLAHNNEQAMMIEIFDHATEAEEGSFDLWTKIRTLRTDTILFVQFTTAPSAPRNPPAPTAACEYTVPFYPTAEFHDPIQDLVVGTFPRVVTHWRPHSGLPNEGHVVMNNQMLVNVNNRPHIEVCVCTASTYDTATRAQGATAATLEPNWITPECLHYAMGTIDDLPVGKVQASIDAQIAAIEPFASRTIFAVALIMQNIRTQNARFVDSVVHHRCNRYGDSCTRRMRQLIDVMLNCNIEDASKISDHSSLVTPPGLAPPSRSALGTTKSSKPSKSKSKTKTSKSKPGKGTPDAKPSENKEKKQPEEAANP